MADSVVSLCDSWSKCLKNIPKTTAFTISNHLKSCGKKEIGEKGYKFFTENYLHNVFARVNGLNDSARCSVKAMCYRSQKKSEAPHKPFVTLKNNEKSAEVVDANCSCKAGVGGHCNHVFALLYLLNHWSLLGIEDIPADLTCTSIAQQWHKPRGESINPEPLMKCVFVKSGNSSTKARKLQPVTCKLYDARDANLRSTGWEREYVMSMCNFLRQEKKQSPFSYLLTDQEFTNTTNTVFGNVPLGSTLDHQLTDLNEDKLTFLFNKPDNYLLFQAQEGFPQFPRIPIPALMPLDVPPELISDPLIKAISITQNAAWELEQKTVSQSQNASWFEARKLRLTASNFGRIINRKQKPTDKFIESLFEQKDLSKVPSVLHGKKNEAIVRSKYAKNLQKKLHNHFTVYDSGLIVQPNIPYLGATPDGKVFDPTCARKFGLLEIKCPFTYRNMTIENACTQSTFPLSMVDGSPKLKKQHSQGYYAQIQGQMALSGLDWCDFVVFLSGSHTISVERILFDPQYWNDELLPKLKSFYFSYAVSYLKNKYF